MFFIKVKKTCFLSVFYLQINVFIIYGMGLPVRLFVCLSVAKPFDAYCCHMGTALKHPVPDRVKLSFVIFDIRALWRSVLSVGVPECQKLQMTA